MRRKAIQNTSPGCDKARWACTNVAVPQSMPSAPVQGKVLPPQGFASTLMGGHSPKLF